MKKINVSLVSGLTVGLAGFTADLFSNSAIFRLIFIILGTLPLFIILPKKTIDKKYKLSVILFSLYAALFIFSSYLNETSIDLIFRELILYYVIIFILILINYEDYFSNYLKGIFISLILLNIYYFFHINLVQLFHPFYRFSLNLNSIGISYLAISLVIMSLFYSQAKENKNILLWILITLGLIILLATKSRTVLFLAILSIVIFNYHRLNKKLFVFFYSFCIFSN